MKGGWKPWQRGILIATTAYLNLTERLLQNPSYTFVLGGRFSTNCVENLFSVVRMKYKVPTVIQWKNCLKSIILTQYARSVASSSYEQEISENFNDSLTLQALDFLRKGKNHSFKNSIIAGINLKLFSFISDKSEKKVQENEPSLAPGWSQCLKLLSSKTENALFHVAGYLLDSIMVF